MRIKQVNPIRNRPSFFYELHLRPKDQLESYDKMYQLDLLFPVLLSRRQDFRSTPSCYNIESA